jgi:putative glutamine amidotransferase
MALKPIIGIIAKSDLFSDSQELPRFSVLKQYVKALNRFGAAVTLIPPQDAEGLKTCFSMINGLLLAGGSDLNVDPNEGYLCLDETNGVDIERDRAEVEMARMALEKDTPVLGICRGMQLLNLVSGGSICQDISSSIPNALKHTSDWRSQERAFHPIQIIQGTMLSSLAGEHSPVEVNGNHHQCVRLLGDRMLRSAVAPDGVVEAIECPSKQYVLGIQWHPEWLIEDDEQLSLNIFSSFVAAAERQSHL